MASINKGDNTGAFGNEFLRIYINNPNDLYIQKAVLQINGNLEKEFYEPKFPLRVNFTGQETEMLSQVNQCKLALWDECGRRRTAEGKFTFFVKENYINQPDEPVCDEPSTDKPDNSISFDLDDADFAAKFSINATPEKLSQLQIDIPLMTPDKIKDGDNIHTVVDEDGNVIISAVLDPNVRWEEIIDKPTINGQPLEGDVVVECVQKNADWNATSGVEQILNKPSFSKLAFTGNWEDVNNKPLIPSKTSQLENDMGYLNNASLDNYYTKEEVDNKIDNDQQIQDLDTKITDLEQKHIQDTADLNSRIIEKVDIVTFNDSMETKADVIYVNDALSQKLDTRNLGKGNLTVKCNNNIVGTFNANAKYDEQIDLTIPQNLSEMNNDMDFVQKKDINLDNYVTQQNLEDSLANVPNKKDIGTGILTIKQNDVSIGTFNANAKTNRNINIKTPLNLSDLNNDISMVTDEDLVQIKQDITQLQSDVDVIPPQLTQLQHGLDNKVNVEPDKSLMPLSEIDRLSKLHDYDDTEVKQLIDTNKQNIEQLNTDVLNKVDKEVGKGLSTVDFSLQDKDNLDKTVELAQVTDIAVSKLKTQIAADEKLIDNNSTQITKTQQKIVEEATQLRDTDNYLQEQIEALTAKSDVVDIVADHFALDDYDLTTLHGGDVICVIKDELKNDTTTYYRFDGNGFLFIGSEGEYYTKTDANKTFVKQSTTINGYALQDNVNLTYTDVNALPEDTIIGDGTITVQRNDVNIGQFNLNQTENLAINIHVPTKVSDIENDEEFIPLQTMFHYIGDVPEDNNLQDQVDVVLGYTQTNATQIQVLKDLITGEIGGLPEVALTGSYNDLKDKPFIPSKTSEVENDSGFITLVDIQENFLTKDDLPTKISELENDRGYVTNNAIGRGILTLQINGTEVGQWMANERENYTWNIPVDNKLSDTSILPVQNNTLTKALKDTDSTAVHKTGDETVNGTKTFQNVILQQATAPTLDIANNSTNVATTAYVKSQDYCTNTDAVHKTQDEIITGVKTFETVNSTNATIVNATLTNVTAITMEQADNSTNVATTAYVKSQDYGKNSEVVHKQGNETIQGNKDFNDTVSLNGIVNLSKYSHVPTPVENDPSLEFTDLITNVEFVNNKISKVTETVNGQIAAVNETITNNKNDVDGKITTINQSIGTINGQITAIDGSINTINQQIETANQQIETNKNDINTANQRIATNAQDIATTNNKFTNYYTTTQTYTQEQVNNLLKEKQDTIDALSQSLTTLTQQYTDLEKRVAALEPQTPPQPTP